MIWTRFMDMSSGGGRKEDFSKLYIEAPEAEAKVIFYNRFGHNPERVTCTCCGEDYSIRQEASLEEATAFDRGCDYDGGYIERASTRAYSGKYVSLKDYVAGGRDINGSFTTREGKEKVSFIYANDIKPEERDGSVPSQGYIWVD